ncbi:uncharacterized protein KY384_004350 [Bacidia gigantensis]|uniref:uncharacterized protein n=1 Tax=Bacidia gigantensis TaxID=2732470 RepID=UPI001D049828|nr:uncharacterized protein KY384_004350 [Bacidia gigantensis]KAG8530993.1 hypothetical protein KY384_004350 [Bacidia gigantensis]
MSSTDIDEASAALIAELYAEDLELLDQPIGSSFQDYEDPVTHDEPESPQSSAWGVLESPIVESPAGHAEEENLDGNWNRTAIRGVDDSDDEETESADEETCGADGETAGENDNLANIENQSTPMKAVATDTSLDYNTIVDGVVDPMGDDQAPLSSEAKRKGKATIHDAIEDVGKYRGVTVNEQGLSHDSKGTFAALPDATDAKRGKNKGKHSWEPRPRPPPSLDPNSNKPGARDECEFDHCFEPCRRRYDPTTGGTSLHITIPWSFSAARLGIVYNEQDDDEGRRGYRRRRERSYEPVKVHEIFLDDLPPEPKNAEGRLSGLTEHLRSLDVASNKDADLAEDTPQDTHGEMTQQSQAQATAQGNEVAGEPATL